MIKLLVPFLILHGTSFTVIGQTATILDTQIGLHGSLNLLDNIPSTNILESAGWRSTVWNRRKESYGERWTGSLCRNPLVQTFPTGGRTVTLDPSVKLLSTTI